MQQSPSFPHSASLHSPPPLTAWWTGEDFSSFELSHSISIHRTNCKENLPTYSWQGYLQASGIQYESPSIHWWLNISLNFQGWGIFFLSAPPTSSPCPVLSSLPCPRPLTFLSIEPFITNLPINKQLCPLQPDPDNLAEVKSKLVLTKAFVLCKQLRSLCYQGIAEKWLCF